MKLMGYIRFGKDDGPVNERKGCLWILGRCVLVGRLMMGAVLVGEVI